MASYRRSKAKIKRALKSDFKKRCLICSDLDGSMLNNYCKIPSFTRKVVKALRKQGHIVCIFTARAKRSSIQYYKQLGLDTPLINYNGARIHNPTDDEFAPFSFYMNKVVILKIFSDKQIHDMVLNVLFETPEGTWFLKGFGKHSHQEIKQGLAKFNVYTSDNINTIEDDYARLPYGAYSVLVTLKDQTKTQEFYERVHQLCDSIIVRSWTEEHVGVIVELNSIFPSKGMALRLLSSYYDIPKDRCYAFGDNENDVEMLLAADQSYAMKNGVDLAKKAAKHITQYTNHEQGVARELNKIFKLGIKYVPERKTMFQNVEIKGKKN